MPLSRFHTMLQVKVEEEIKRVGAEITSGRMKDHETYRDAVGYVRGLIDSLKLADQVEQEMTE